MTDTDKLGVTQADREAALPFIATDFRPGDTYSTGYYVRRGERDDHPLVQAFARHRTAHSGDLGPGLERAAQWHDARCKGPDVFEQELHEVSARALRHLATNREATNMQALDAAHSGEGRSYGAGEEVARVVHAHGPVVIDWMGENLAWRPFDHGTWTPLAALADQEPKP